MQILGAGKKPATVVLLVSSAALLVACGGTTVFSGKAPVAVVGALPPPPPPPPEPPPKPPEPPPKVVVKDNKIEITEKIQFEYNKAVIKPESFGLMDEIAGVIKKNPHIKKIGIEGHASSEGDAKHNLKLSDERAHSVATYLIEKGGVNKDVLDPKGFGSQRPLVDDSAKAVKGKSKEEAEELHEKNRRVEFNILEQDVTKKKVSVDATTGKETVLEEKTHAVKNESPEVAPADEKKKDDKKEAAKDDKKDDKKAPPKKK
jgi:outer membrane protein OmpA-like peptidoglycan-associated protein